MNYACPERGRRELRIKNGFTLIELLIVIAIISILATLLMVNLVGVRQRARDGQRKADLRQIQSALELYRSDQSTYPTSGSGDGYFPTSCGVNVSFTSGSTVYMQHVPCDPTTNTAYQYVSDTNNSTYCLRACLENIDDSQTDAKTGITCPIPGLSDCPSGSEKYTLQNP